MGAGLDVRGVREWRPGDAVRHVHWRSTARTGRLTVFEYGEPTVETFGVLIAGTRADPRFEAELAIAASTTWQGLDDGIMVFVSCADDAIPNGKQLMSVAADPDLLRLTPTGFHKIFASLLPAVPEPETVDALLDRVGVGGVVVLATGDGLSDAFLSYVESAASVAGVRLIRVADYQDPCTIRTPCDEPTTAYPRRRQCPRYPSCLAHCGRRRTVRDHAVAQRSLGGSSHSAPTSRLGWQPCGFRCRKWRRAVRSGGFRLTMAPRQATAMVIIMVGAVMVLARVNTFDPSSKAAALTTLLLVVQVAHGLAVQTRREAALGCAIVVVMLSVGAAFAGDVTLLIPVMVALPAVAVTASLLHRGALIDGADVTSAGGCWLDRAGLRDAGGARYGSRTRRLLGPAEHRAPAHTHALRQQWRRLRPGL